MKSILLVISFFLLSGQVEAADTLLTVILDHDHYSSANSCYIDSGTLYKNGDVITYGYKLIMNKRGKDELSASFRKHGYKKIAQDIERESYSMNFCQINLEKRLWRPVSSVSYSKTGQVLDFDDKSNYPFVPMPPSRSLAGQVIDFLLNLYSAWIKED